MAVGEFGRQRIYNNNLLEYVFHPHLILKKKRAIRKELLMDFYHIIELNVVILGGSTMLIEENRKYKINCLGEPQLGKRGLYPTISTKSSGN